MNQFRRMAAWIAAAMLLLAAGSTAGAEATAEKKTNRGRVTEITWKDEDGNITAGPEGYAVIRYEYEYQKTTERYYDAEGFPCEAPGGYYGRIIEDDGINKFIRYIGIDGRLTMTRMGYAKVSYRHFSFGMERYVVFYDVKERPVMVPSLGYAQVENQCNGYTLTGRIYMDEKGNKVDIPAGYAMMQKKMNRSRQIVRTWYEHADGSPATGPDGWSWSVITRDGNNKGRIDRIEFFDEKGNLTEAGGYAREEYAYRKDGLVKVTRFDLQGNMISFGGDAVSVRRKMKDEMVLEETFLNEAGDPTTLPAGYATVSYAYGANGQLELIQYRDTAGEKTTCRNGYSAIREARDVNGRLLSMTYLDINGQAVNHSVTGVSEERYEYDDEGKMTGKRQYDSSGALLIPKE